MNCSDTEDLVRDIRFRAVVGAQATAAFISLIISSVVLKRCGRLYFHLNCKILIVAMLAVYVVHSIILGGLQGTQLYRYITILDPCDVLVKSVICFSVGLSRATCTTALVLLEFAMVVERAIALWKRSFYDSFGPKLGIVLVIVTILLSLLSCIWAMSDEDFSQSYAYCSPVTAHTTKKMTMLIFASSGVSALTLCTIAVLIIFNSFAKKRKSFNLTISYQIRENDTVLRLLLPLEIFQALVSGFACTSSYIIVIFRDQLSAVTYRAILTGSNLFPYYTIVSPILLWFIIRWSQRLKADKIEVMLKKTSEDENNIYFRTYTEMWGNGPQAHGKG